MLPSESVGTSKFGGEAKARTPPVNMNRAASTPPLRLQVTDSLAVYVAMAVVFSTTEGATGPEIAGGISSTSVTVTVME